MPEKLIQTDEENAVVIAIISRLMDYDPEPESESGILLKGLATIVQEYEKKYD